MEKFYKKFVFDFSDVGIASLVLVSLLFNANVNAQLPRFKSIPELNNGTPSVINTGTHKGDSTSNVSIFKSK